MLKSNSPVRQYSSDSGKFDLAAGYISVCKISLTNAQWRAIKIMIDGH